MTYDIFSKINCYMYRSFTFADGAVCKYPADVVNKDLQAAIDLFDCLPSTSTNQSVPMSPLAEVKFE